MCCDELYWIVGVCDGMLFVVGVGEGENFLVFDVIVLLGIIDCIVYLENGDVVDI